PDIIPVVMIAVVIMTAIMIVIVPVMMVMAIHIAVVGIGGAHVAAATGASGGGRDAFELWPDRYDVLQLLLRQVLRRTAREGPRGVVTICRKVCEVTRPGPAPPV